jgi:hypothetical protein
MRHHLATALALFALAACEQPKEITVPPHAADMHASMQKLDDTPEVRQKLAALRALTARFHDFEVARAAKYDTRITSCFSDPTQGGMGYHYGNPQLIDGTPDADNPELLLYEPQKDGSLRFVAVEYVVPFDAWTAPQPPELYGIPFHRNEAFGLWVLHVWHFRDNPSGIFMDWNPKVSCKFATE